MAGEFRTRSCILLARMFQRGKRECSYSTNIRPRAYIRNCKAEEGISSAKHANAREIPPFTLSWSRASFLSGMSTSIATFLYPSVEG